MSFLGNSPTLDRLEVFKKVNGKGILLLRHEKGVLSIYQYTDQYQYSERYRIVYGILCPKTDKLVHHLVTSIKFSWDH